MTVSRCNELEHVHCCACVSECIGVLGEGGRRQVCMCVRVCSCVHLNVVEVLGSCSRHAWETLWVLPSLLLQPQTHAGTHTTSFSLSFILHLILWPLSQIIFDFFFFYQPVSFSDSTATLLYLRIAIYCMLHNCCHDCPPPLFCVAWNNLTCHSGTLLGALSTFLYEIDKCIGYWLSPMPTSTSKDCFTGPLHCPLSTSCPAGAGVSLAGLGAPSGDQWAVTGSSSASRSLQSGARWGLVRELSLPKWPQSNCEEKKRNRPEFTRFSLCSVYELSLVTNKCLIKYWQKNADSSC